MGEDEEGQGQQQQRQQRRRLVWRFDLEDSGSEPLDFSVLFTPAAAGTGRNGGSGGGGSSVEVCGKRFFGANFSSTTKTGSGQT
eukprot:COSAG06_NODE_18610_length_877_cov_2.056555_1_plen_84_part_00